MQALAASLFAKYRRALVSSRPTIISRQARDRELLIISQDIEPREGGREGEINSRIEEGGEGRSCDHASATYHASATPLTPLPRPFLPLVVHFERILKPMWGEGGPMVPFWRDLEWLRSGGHACVTSS